MTTANLLVLIFFIVPGFIADTVLRAAYVDKRLSDFERTVRSIILSVFGLLAYLSIVQLLNSALMAVTDQRIAGWMLAPPYLTTLGSAKEAATELNAYALVPFAVHTLVTVALALSWGKLVASQRAEQFFITHTGRLTVGTSWQLLWSRFYPVTLTAPPSARKRLVTAVLQGGGRIMGELQSASTPLEDKDLVLGNPWFWHAERKDWHAQNTRFVYIPMGRIEYIALSPGGGETALSGFLSDLAAQQAEQRRDDEE